MVINQQKNGTTLDIALEGRLDTMTSPQLEAVLNDELAGMTELKFDFAKLEYISSAGLRVLLSSQKAMDKQGTMEIRNVCAEIMEVFEITGFSEFLKIV